MKKLNKNCKKGFTLVEMVLVIAIIVILAAVMLMGIGNYIDKAKVAASDLTEHVDSVDYVVGEIDAKLNS
ncbi:MAG: type II secretion system GspH family protein [Clostridia bacterium]|nr:type II secretion system GspH family protein [Clostridia bacterium]